MIKKLLVNDGRRDRELVLLDRLVVGRDPTCDVSHDDALLSRRHAEFDASGDQVIVRDLGSRNGIFVNGLRTAEQVLRPGDIVQIGPLKVRYAQDGTPISILPEQLVHDRTVAIPSAGGAAVLPPVTPRLASVEADSSERTQIISVPRAEPARPLTARPAPIVAANGDDDATHFLPAPKVAASGAHRTAPAITAPPITATMPRIARSTTNSSVPASVTEPAVRTFVFVQLFVLGGVVALSATVPLVMWRGELLAAGARPEASAPLAWLALPLGVAAAAAYFVGSVINRRVEGALRRTGNSPGIPRT